MPQYQCEKCGETAYSKNVATRNVFPSDQLAAIMTQITNVMTDMQENGRRKVTIEFPYCDTDESLTNDELEYQCLKNIQGLDEGTIKHWICSHKWELAPGSEEPTV